MRKILGVFKVFLGVFEKTKEKKDMVGSQPQDEPEPQAAEEPAIVVDETRKLVLI